MVTPSRNSLPILVVDDYRETAAAIAEVLTLSGYDARAATSGEEALRIADERPPACVLLDVVMPGMDGVELAMQLRQRYAGDVTLIAMTGLDQSSKQHTLVMALVDHFLAKPVDFKMLMKLLAPLGE